MTQNGSGRNSNKQETPTTQSFRIEVSPFDGV